MTEPLKEMLAKFADIDRLMDENEDFDAAELIGDLRDKVDAIKYRIDTWESEIEALQTAWIDPLTVKKKALQSKIDRLKEYCRFYMKQNQFTKIPGNAFELREQILAPLVKTAPAGPKMALDFPTLCKAKPNVYAWDKNKLREILKDPEQAEIYKSYATLQPNSCFRFYTKKGK